MHSLKTMCLSLLASIAVACLASASPQESARTLLERAAFAEEHERDFAEAESLYAQAASAARAAGDAATESAASAAGERVLARQGKSSQAPAAGELSPQAVSLFVVGAGTPDTEFRKRAIADLAIVGAPAVPWLERMLAAPGPIEIADQRVELDVDFAAAALAAMSIPEAGAALERGFASPDPLVRKAIVAALGQRHEALLRRAATDPVPAIADLAIKWLTRLEDPALVTLFEPAARRRGDALEWLADHAPERALAIAEDRSIHIDLRESALAYLRRSRPGLPASAEIATRLLAIGREPADAKLRGKAQQVLHEHLSARWTANLDALREPIGKLVIAELGREPAPQLIATLGALQLPSLPRDLLALTKKLPAGIDEDTRAALTGVVSNARVEPTAAALDAWVELARAIPASWHTNNSPRVIDEAMNVVRRLAERGVPVEAVARAARGWSDELRPSYSSSVASRVNLALRAAGQGPSGFRPGTLDRSILPLLFAWLELDRGGAAGAVAEALAGIGDVEQLPVLLDMLANTREAGISSVQRAASVLIEHEPVRGAAILAQRVAPLAAAAAPSEEALEFVHLMGNLPAPDALAMFRTWWPKCVSAAAKQALLSTLVGSISGPEATAEVIARYRDIAPESHNTRRYAIHRFAREIAFDAVPLLGEALSDPSDEVRKAAREASQAFKDQREALEEFAAWTKASEAARDSVAELAKLLESNNRDVVLGAVNALAAVKARTALPQLVKLLERNDPELKQAVQAAIAKIGE